MEAKSEVSEGFILSRQWTETEDGQDLLFWIASDQGPIRIQLSAQESVFFIRHADLVKVQSLLANQVSWRHAEVDLLAFQKVGSEGVVACYFPHQKMLNFARSRLEQSAFLFMSLIYGPQTVT